MLRVGFYNFVVVFGSLCVVVFPFLKKQFCVFLFFDRFVCGSVFSSSACASSSFDCAATTGGRRVETRHHYGQQRKRKETLFVLKLPHFTGVCAVGNRYEQEMFVFCV